MKGALGKGRPSLKRLTAEGLERRLLYGRPWVMKGRLWRRASLFMGTQLGNLEWARLLGTERWLKGALEVERLSLSLWELCEGNLEGGLAGDPGEEGEKVLEVGISFHRGPAGEPGRGLIYQGV
jgi:hypothetical protein